MSKEYIVLLLNNSYDIRHEVEREFDNLAKKIIDNNYTSSNSIEEKNKDREKLGKISNLLSTVNKSIDALFDLKRFEEI